MSEYKVAGKMYYLDNIPYDEDRYMGYHALWEKLEGGKIGKFFGWYNIETNVITEKGGEPIGVLNIQTGEFKGVPGS